MLEERMDFGLILDHVPAGVTVQDQRGRLIYANATAAHTLGFATAAELLSASLPEVVARYAIYDEDGQPFPPERLPGRRALAGDAEPAATVRFVVHASGDERWSMIRATPVRDAAGIVRFAINIWQDATADKRAEAGQRFLAQAGEALATSLDVEATLTTIAQLAVPRLADWCAVSLVRVDGTVSQLAVVHVDPERVAWARTLQERYPVDPEADYGLPQVLRTRRSQLVPNVTDEMLVAVARDPEHLDILRRVGMSSAIIAPMVVHERVVGAISFVAAESGHAYDERDLVLAEDLARRAALAVENARLYDAERGARRQAEEARARFRTLVEGVPDAILVLNAAGRCIDANPAACALLGYALDDLLRLEAGVIFPHDDVASARPPAPASDPVDWAETEVRRRDGTPLPVEVWTRRLDLPAGPIALTVVRDISDRLAADAIREEVLSAISHDLRNPLGSIKLYAQTLQRTLRRGEAPDLARLESSLAAIDAMATRATFLLDDIVDVVRSRGSGGVPFTPEPVDVAALVRRCAAEAGPLAGRPVLVESAVDSVLTMGDPRALERVVHNLINNGLKYSPEGGDVVARVELAGDGDRQVVVMVTDQGMGIPAADLPHIFEPYRRGRNVGQISGTGLGLSGVKQVVERHGGTIAIDSAEGRGTRVTVRLPYEPPESG